VARFAALTIAWSKIEYTPLRTTGSFAIRHRRDSRPSARRGSIAAVSAGAADRMAGDVSWGTLRSSVEFVFRTASAQTTASTRSFGPALRGSGLSGRIEVSLRVATRLERLVGRPEGTRKRALQRLPGRLHVAVPAVQFCGE